MVKSIQYDKDTDPITDYPLLIRATFVALKNLDGKAEIHKLQKEVARLLNLTDKQIERKIVPSYPLSEFEYRTKKARTYLQDYGVIYNFGEEWSITDEYIKRGIYEDEAEYISKTRGHEVNEEEIVASDKFKDELLHKVQHMNCFNFELLVSEVLTQSGFKNCKVTPRNNDGGIDVTAILTVLGGKSVPVVVQCKEYYKDFIVKLSDMNAFIGVVKPSGAIMIYVTSNIFVEPALERAEKENVITIDKDQLIELLIKNEIGCKYDDNIKDYFIDNDYFNSLYEVERD